MFRTNVFSFRFFAPAAAMAILSLHSGPAPAQEKNETTSSLDEVIVSASRLGVGIAGASTTIIDAEDIERSPAQTLPEIMGAEAGIQYRDLFGDRAGAQAVLDIRGFGATATSNTLVLVNGRRMNDIDLAAIDWANIPLDSIERIEITRGNAGSVLYGDGAVGGTVNIVTKDPHALGRVAKAEASYSSYVFRQSKFTVSDKVGDYAVTAYGSYINSRGYRINNDLIQRTFNAEAQRKMKKGRAFVKIGVDNESQGAPGARKVTLNSNLVETDPRGATTEEDKNWYNGIFATAGVTHALSDSLNLIVDGGVRRKDQEARTVSSFGTQFDTYIDTELTTWSLTPRIEADAMLSGMGLSSTFGLDYYYADYNSDRQTTFDGAAFHVYNGFQQSLGLYAQNTLALNKKTDVSFGARVQRTNFRAGDMYDSSLVSSPAFDGKRGDANKNEIQLAANLGLDYRINDTFAVFGRAARSFRTPTIDERVGSDSGYASFELKTQTSRDIEAGARFTFGKFELQSSAFYMRLRDELHYNPDTFVNMNFDPTERAGLENAFTWKIRNDLKLKGNVSWTRAKFSEGRYDGNEVPLVSDITASAAVYWDVFKEKLKLTAAVNYFGKKRMENDENNFQAQISDYALFDLGARGKYGRLNWSADINNVFNQGYFNYAIASSSTYGTYNAYTLPGRTFKLTAGMEF